MAKFRVVTHLVDDGLNSKLFLVLFIDQLLGLKINFHKSEFFATEMQKNCVDQYSHILDVGHVNILSNIWAYP